MNKKINYQHHLEWVAPILLGGLIFYVVAGLSILDPRYISWLQDGDPSQQYLGWVFFREDIWRFPPGLNPTFGMDIGGSIVYSDSIPLMALFFKLFRSYLSTPFQYFGVWTFFCFLMQAIAAWNLSTLFSKQWFLKVLNTALITFSLPLLWRLGFHNYLMAHFLVLFALYLAFKGEEKRDLLKWIFLLCISVLVNFYIYLMVLVLWLGYLFDRLSVRNLTKKIFLINFLVALTCSLFLMWMSGYFSVNSSVNVATGMYGSSKLNLLTLVDANQWSWIISRAFPTLKYFAGNNYESFHFLGIGLLVLLGLALINLGSSPKRFINIFSQKRYLFLGILMLSIFAITNQVTLGSLTLQIPIPSAVYNIASGMRSSGRMFLPAYYCIVLGILILVNYNYSLKKLYLILTLALFMQIIDTADQWKSRRFQLNQGYDHSDSWKISSPLKHPFWWNEARQYQQLITIFDPMPKGYIPENWRIFADYGVTNHMKTNAAYLARFDEFASAEQYRMHYDAIASGNYQPDTMYIFDEEKILPVLSSMNKNRDLLIKVDGFYVLAPNLKSCKYCEVISSNLPSAVGGNRQLLFRKGGNGTEYLIGVDKRQVKGWGWTYPEDWGVWSEGNKAKIIIPLSSSDIKSVAVKMRAFITQNHPQQKINISVNNINVGTYVLTSDLNEIRFDVPENAKSKYMIIEFQLPDNVSPKKLGIGDDYREIAIGLIKMQFLK